MKLEELRRELDELAGPAAVPTDEAVDHFAGGLRRARRRRRNAIVSAVVLCSIVVAGAALKMAADDRRSSLEVTVNQTERQGRPVARLYVPNPVLEPGADSRVAAVVVQNGTGHEVSWGDCGPPFQTVLFKGTQQPDVAWPAFECLITHVVHTGTTTFPVAVRTSGCLAGVPCAQSYPPPPFPPGRYRLGLASNAGILLKIAPPVSVRVAHTECASTGSSVRVPDVSGLSIKRAIRAVKAAGLNVINAGVPDDDPVTPDARVYAQEPGAGERVPRGACIGFRTR